MTSSSTVTASCLSSSSSLPQSTTPEEELADLRARVSKLEQQLAKSLAALESRQAEVQAQPEAPPSKRARSEPSPRTEKTFSQIKSPSQAAIESSPGQIHPEEGQASQSLGSSNSQSPLPLANLETAASCRPPLQLVWPNLLQLSAIPSHRSSSSSSSSAEPVPSIHAPERTHLAETNKRLQRAVTSFQLSDSRANDSLPSQSIHSTELSVTPPSKRPRSNSTSSLHKQKESFKQAIKKMKLLEKADEEARCQAAIKASLSSSQIPPSSVDAKVIQFFDPQSLPLERLKLARLIKFSNPNFSAFLFASLLAFYRTAFNKTTFNRKEEFDHSKYEKTRREIIEELNDIQNGTETKKTLSGQLDSIGRILKSSPDRQRHPELLPFFAFLNSIDHSPSKMPKTKFSFAEALKFAEISEQGKDQEVSQPPPASSSSQAEDLPSNSSSFLIPPLANSERADGQFPSQFVSSPDFLEHQRSENSSLEDLTTWLLDDNDEDFPLKAPLPNNQETITDHPLLQPVQSPNFFFWGQLSETPSPRATDQLPSLQREHPGSLSLDELSLDELGARLLNDDDELLS